MNTNTAESIEQIYNFLKEDESFSSRQQFDKIERLLQELHTQGEHGFLAEKPYKFKFHFSGCSYSFDREKRFDRICKLADKGLVLNQSMWASAMGIEPQIFERSLEESKYSDWINKFSTLMLNSNTTGQNSPGRPKKDDIDLSESGQMNRDVESNI